MVFSSLEFLFVFFPICIFLYYIIQKKSLELANVVLLVASLFFYIRGEKGLVFVMILSSSIDYYLGKIIYNLQAQKNNNTASKEKLILFLSIFLNLSILVYFKYSNFFLNEVVDFFNLFGLQLSKSTLNITLPLGISFYTFQSMSYTIDVYRKNITRCYSFSSFLTYVTFFPQLVAGPIVRYRDIEISLKERKFNLTQILEGMTRFSFGLAKKIIIANQMSFYADAYFDQNIANIDSLGAWIGITAYTLQIYFDFSGYSDMAIGLGRVFGFNFPENFNYPYQARSIQDFWRRWHISLSSWFRDYLYIPLGGNRKSNTRTILNLYIVFFLCGLWHGASFNFVIWGLFHGTFLMIERVVEQNNLNKFKLKIFGHIYCIIIVMIGWVFFRSVDFKSSILFIEKMFSFTPTSVESLNHFLSFNFLAILSTGALLSSSIIFQSIKRFKNIEYFIALFLLVLSSLILIQETLNPFIYFRF